MTPLLYSKGLGKLFLIFTLLFNLQSLALLSQESSPEWVKKLPANTWTKIDQGKSGNRINASVNWLPKEQKLILIGGLIGKSNRESPKPAKSIFDATTNTWEEYKDEPAIPAIANLTVKDSTKKLSVTIKLPAGSENLAGEKIATNSPLTSIAPISQLSVLEGATILFDPIHKEIHLIGGASGGAPKGSLGNLIYSLEKNVWENSPGDLPPLKSLRKNISEAVDFQKDTVAFARNILHASLNETELKTKGKELSTRQTLSSKAFSDLALRVEKESASFGLDAENTAESISKLKMASSKADEAGKAFAAGTIDAPNIASIEAATWLADEANDCIASEPTPRRNATGIFDPERKQFIVFGGDHGDYLLCDTWHYDCAKKKWKRVNPEFSPSPRFGGQMFWLPQTKTVAMLSGQTYLHKMVYQSFSQKLEPDVWVYDPIKFAWSMAVKPGPEVAEKSPDNYPWFVVNNPVIMTQFGVLICPAVGGNTYQDFMTSSTWMLKLEANSATQDLTKKWGTPKSQRFYRSQIVPAYNPNWYDAAKRMKTSSIDKLIATMPTNQWVEMPIAERACPERSWGTSLYDPKRDQIYFWTGGHCADPADIVHFFHPGSNAWSIPYVAGGVTLGNQFTGRPDCQNHTYKNYAYDFTTNLLVATHRAGTHVFDPDRREWVGYTPNQPFVYNVYSAKCVGTPKGVMAWAGGCTEAPSNGLFLELFDAKALKWTSLPIKSGKIPANVHGDEDGMTWDSKRKLLYLNAANTYMKGDGRVHCYNPDTQEMLVLDPKNRDTIGDKFYTYRETVYLPDVDLVLFGMGFLNGKQIFYDPKDNRWVLSNIPKTSSKATFDATKEEWGFAPAKPHQHLGSITFCPSLDTNRNVLWAPSDYQTMFVLKLDGKKLELTDGQ